MHQIKKRTCFLILFLAGLLTLSSCDYFGSGSGFDPLISVETDRDHYVIGEDDVIGVTVTNISEIPLRYNTCLPKMLEVIRDGKVIETIGHPVCYCNCMTTLEPGETIKPEISDFMLHAVLSLREDSFEFGDDVQYQIMVGVSGSVLLGEEDTRSNRFHISRQETEN